VCGWYVLVCLGLDGGVAGSKGARRQEQWVMHGAIGRLRPPGSPP
jgi:hypothetical protein